MCNKREYELVYDRLLMHDESDVRHTERNFPYYFMCFYVRVLDIGSMHQQRRNADLSWSIHNEDSGKTENVVVKRHVCILCVAFI